MNKKHCHMIIKTIVGILLCCAYAYAVDMDNDNEEIASYKAIVYVIIDKYRNNIDGVNEWDYQEIYINTEKIKQEYGNIRYQVWKEVYRETHQRIYLRNGNTRLPGDEYAYKMALVALSCQADQDEVGKLLEQHAEWASQEDQNGNFSRMKQLLITLSYGPKEAVREIYHRIGKMKLSKVSNLIWSRMLEGVGNEESADLIDAKAKNSLYEELMKISSKIIRRNVNKQYNNQWDSERYQKQSMVYWRAFETRPGMRSVMTDYGVAAMTMLGHGNVLSHEYLQEQMMLYSAIPDDRHSGDADENILFISVVMVMHDKDKAKEYLNRYVHGHKNKYGEMVDRYLKSLD